MKRWIVCTASFGLAVLAHAQQPAPDAGSADKPYGVVVDGTKVNTRVMEGFRTWRAAACDRCHGANQEGLVGPSLLEGMKVLSKDEFKKTIAEGRLEKGMPSWKESRNVMDHMEELYAYLKGRADGAITKARVEPQK